VRRRQPGGRRRLHQRVQERGICGDGIVGPGEMCDDGNQEDTDECTNACAPASCGDTIVNAGVEECDDGNADDTDACLATCLAAKCGDMADPGRRRGVRRRQRGRHRRLHRTMCKTAKCGDMIRPGWRRGVRRRQHGRHRRLPRHVQDRQVRRHDRQAGVEECDDGNMVDTDMCLNTCKTAKCGDGKVQMGVEECDDGNMVRPRSRSPPRPWRRRRR
jgi:cysteine-rich repeat protein